MHPKFSKLPEGPPAEADVLPAGTVRGALNVHRRSVGMGFMCVSCEAQSILLGKTYVKEASGRQPIASWLFRQISLQPGDETRNLAVRLAPLLVLPPG